MFSHKKAMIIDTKKDMQKVYKKLLAHPLVISVYVVYYARAFFINERSLECVCVCYTFIWIDQIKDVKSRNIFIFCLHFYTDTSYCFDDVHNEHRVQSYKVLLEVANNAAKNMHAPAFTRFEAALVCRRWLLLGLQSGNIQKVAQPIDELQAT